MSGHTPGPWRWHWFPSTHTLDYPQDASAKPWDGTHDEDGTPIDPEYGLDFDALSSADDSVLYGVWHNDDTAGIGVSAEDAHLIAAAPDLLEAAKDLLAYVDERGYMGKPFAELTSKVQMAVEKAEGRT